MLAFSRAVGGLRVAEQNLYVTSNNLSNVNTDGYRRQRLIQSELQTTSRGDFNIGLGVDASTVKQIKSEYLETNYRNELAEYGEYAVEDQVYSSLQSIIGSDGSSVQTTLDSLWESFNELSKEYTTSVAGGYLRENAVAIVAEFEGIEDQLSKMQNELDLEVKSVVTKINDYASQIAELNSQITSSEGGGVMSCELRDSRDSIICELSKLLDIEVEPFSNTSLNIRCGNGHLVVGTAVNKLDTDQIVSQSTFSFPIWESTGEALKVNSGELKGILDMRGESVVGNLANSSNGSPKEKMDVVVSIDNDLSLANIQAMRDNISSLVDTLDRQGSNYQFYSNYGNKIDGDTLKNYVDYLYGTAMLPNVQNYAGNPTSFVDFNSAMSNVCNSEKVITEYMESKGLTLEVLRQQFDGINEEVTDLIDKYKSNGGSNVVGFQKYLKELENADNISDEVQTYIDGTGLDIDGLETYISEEMVNLPQEKMDEVNQLLSANSSNVLDNVDKYNTFIKYREDSNKYMLLFTDQAINPGTDVENTAAMLNEIDMRLIAVTNGTSKSGWMTLAQETDGNVYDIDDLKTEDGAEKVGLALSRDFNSRLSGTEKQDGIPAFRAGLNSLLNGLANEINAIFRQGANAYGNRTGDVVKDKDGNVVLDEETGEPTTYNLDLFVKKDENLPLQMGNIEINPLFSDIYNMPLSLSGNTGDFQIGNMLVDLSTSDIFNCGNNYSTANEHYADFVLNFAQAANLSITGYESQEAVVNAANEKRLAISSVSMDEELSNMIKFQYSYTAASKLIGVVDEMLNTIIQL